MLHEKLKNHIKLVFVISFNYSLLELKKYINLYTTKTRL